jgi:hypothetical protein
MNTLDRITEYLKAHGQATGHELAEYLAMSDRGVRKNLKIALDEKTFVKVGKPPKVYYSLASSAPKYEDMANDVAVDKKVKSLIDKQFLYITPLGTAQSGWTGFVYWCNERKLDPAKSAVRYIAVNQKYEQYRKDGLIDGISKMRSSFKEVALDRLFYIDFYSVEIFGKTKLGQLLLLAKQAQDRAMIDEIADLIKPAIIKVINKYKIDGVGFIPPTVKREVQLIRQVQKKLNLNVREVTISKVRTPIIVPQKTLTKLDDRVANARETLVADSTGSFENILLIDDAVGSGATLNEVAKKIRQKGMCSGEIIGLAITGSFKGFEVISEI